MSLKIESRREKDILVMVLSGKILLGDGTGTLRDQVKADLAAGARHLVLNLSAVSYMDSAGLGELVGCRTSAFNAGGEVALVGLQKKINDLMTVTKLLTVFEVFDTEAAALQALGAKSAAPGHAG